MIIARIPDNEQARLAAIARYQLDGPGREPAFDHAVQLAADTFEVPISVVSIVGADLQCFKGLHGLDVGQTGRDVSFCSHTILEPGLLVVEDALSDPRFADNPLVVGDPSIRFYAGAPLRLRDGHVPGTICLIDRSPRQFSLQERVILQRLANFVVDLIELRLEGAMAAERHRALDRMKDEFLAATSHELRTPITSIVGSLGLLTTFAEQIPERAKRLVHIAHSNSLRLARLVNDVLDMSKVAAGNAQFESETLDAGRVLSECQDANSGYGAPRNVRLVMGSVPENLWFRADPHRLQQVLANLVSNAIKFSDADSEVALWAEERQGHVSLHVADTGRGIPDEFRHRIFQRFEQADASDALLHGGAGLGLAISRELVNQMGGEIDFRSKMGEGTDFSVTFHKV